MEYRGNDNDQIVYIPFVYEDVSERNWMINVGGCVHVFASLHAVLVGCERDGVKECLHPVARIPGHQSAKGCSCARVKATL